MLIHKKEEFCQNIMDGMNQADAYRNSYDTENMSDSTIYKKASELMRKPDIRARLAELRAALDELDIFPRSERLQTLKEIATRKSRGETVRDSDVTQAIKVYNEMVGDNAPAKQQTETKLTITTNDARI